MAYLLLMALSVATLFSLCGGCSHDVLGGGGPIRVPLSYTPEHAKDSIRPYPGEIPKAKIYVGAFEDKRDRKDAIGQNTEGSSPTPVLTDNDPAEFVRQTLAAQFRQAGLNVVDDAAHADRVVSGDLLRFWVLESNNYEAEIDATIRVSDQSGAVKWQGDASGKGQNFGRSRSAENYRETLGDAMVRLTYESLLPNAAFQNALK